MNTDFNACFDKRLAPVAEQIGYLRMVDDDGRRCRELTIGNGVFDIRFFYDTMDAASIQVRFANEPGQRTDYEQFVEQHCGLGISIKQYLGGWITGGLKFPDFEKAFEAVAETLPVITEKCASIKEGQYVK